MNMNDRNKGCEKGRRIKTGQKQVLIYSDDKNKIKTELLHPTILKPVILDLKKRQQIVINECTAAEKIESYPESIQKLVWRALYYKNEIRVRKAMFLRGNEQDEKLAKFIEAFRRTQQLILKMCKRRNLEGIIIEEKLIIYVR